MINESDTQKQYYDALKKITEKNIKPTKSSVAKEAGRDRSSIKPDSRPWMNELIDDINKALTTWTKKNKGKDQELRAKIKTRDDRINELEKDLNNARTKELLLLRKVRDLEMEASSKNQSNTTLADMSINLPDWTK